MIIALVAAFEGFQDGQQVLCEVIELSILLYFDVCKVRMNSRRDVGGECPGRGCPYQQVFARVVYQRQAYIEAEVGGLFVPLRFYLHVGDAGGTARTPRHDIVAFIDQALLETLLQEKPDGIIILI